MTSLMSFSTTKSKNTLSTLIVFKVCSHAIREETVQDLNDVLVGPKSPKPGFPAPLFLSQSSPSRVSLLPAVSVLSPAQHVRTQLASQLLLVHVSPFRPAQARLLPSPAFLTRLLWPFLSASSFFSASSSLSLMWNEKADSIGTGLVESGGGDGGAFLVTGSGEVDLDDDEDPEVEEDDDDELESELSSEDGCRILSLLALSVEPFSFGSTVGGIEASEAVTLDSAGFFVSSSSVSEADKLKPKGSSLGASLASSSSESEPKEKRTLGDAAGFSSGAGSAVAVADVTGPVDFI